jgi:hypothetical protein
MVSDVAIGNEKVIFDERHQALKEVFWALVVF